MEEIQSCPPGETKPILTTTQHGKLGSPGVRSVHHFLAEKYVVGLRHCSMNCYCSVLSPALLPVDGFQVGQHPLGW